MNKTWNLKEMKKLIPLALPVLVVNLSIVGMWTLLWPGAPA